MDINSFALGYSAGKKKGGVELNIAYGDTPPEDTTKLWVKTEEPSGIEISRYIDTGGVRLLREKLPIRMCRQGCARVGKYIYLFCGLDKSGNALNTIYRFDTETKETELLPQTIPNYFNVCCAVAFDTTIYVFGVKGSYAYAYKFNTTDYSIESAGEFSGVLPTFTNCYKIGTIVYFATVRTDSSTSKRYFAKYDIETNKFSVVGVYLNTGYYTNGACVGTKIYIMGGDFVNTGLRGYIYCFDTEKISISTLPATIANFASGNVCFAFGKYVYSIGGTSKPHPIIRLDTETYAVEEINSFLPFNLDYSALSSQDDEVYLFGGMVDNVKKDYIMKFNPNGEGVATDRSLRMFPDPDATKFVKINTKTESLDIGVTGIYKTNDSGKTELVESAIYKNGEWVDA